MRYLAKNDCMYIAGGERDKTWEKIELSRGKQALDKQMRFLCRRAESVFGEEMSSFAEFEDCEAILRKARGEDARQGASKKYFIVNNDSPPGAHV